MASYRRKNSLAPRWTPFSSGDTEALAVSRCVPGGAIKVDPIPAGNLDSVPERVEQGVHGSMACGAQGNGSPVRISDFPFWVLVIVIG
jgi:hypothetical protein